MKLHINPENLVKLEQVEHTYYLPM